MSDLEDKIDRLTTLVRDQKRTIDRIDRRERRRGVARFLKYIVWFVMIAVAYYYLSPIVSSLQNSYQNIQDASDSVSQLLRKSE